MIPKKYDAHEYDYPDFQPDQVLSADHLNHSFAFNEQQERLTRTNLIGIGIVCGLKATRSADGKTVTISKGTGITSQGYLVVHGKENSEDPIDYKKYRSFAADIIKPTQYDVLVAGGVPRYSPIYELLDSVAAQPTDLDLSDAFLKDKVCLLFYEMLEVDAKNCDTTSCDDKGKTVTINIRKLLISYKDADSIIAELNAKANSTGSGEVFPGALNLPEIRLPRFDVAATSLITTSDIYKAYQKVFTKQFVEGLGAALNSAYNIFKTYLKDNTNPFANFNANFAFLSNGTIAGNDLLYFQYQWDFFCDLIAAYNEWRLAAQPLGAMCTPPEALFPRHLFLANFNETEGVEKSKYRNYFIPSPVLSNQDQGFKEFKSLFQRLVRMVANKSLPSPSYFGTPLLDANIRITPSLLGNYPLGAKAIPYYYKPNEAANKLVDVWNYAEAKRGKQNLTLSYNPAYNATDDFVKNPLSYDLEPYNFFRVEGHIGKTYVNVLNNLKTLINGNRLPIDVIALELSTDPANTTIDDVCGIENIQMQYELLIAEIKCCLKKNIAYWGQLVVADTTKTSTAPSGAIISEAAIQATFDPKDIAVNVNVKEGAFANTLDDIKARFGTASPAVIKEVQKFVTGVTKASASTTKTSEAPKAEILQATIPIFSGESIAGKYLDLQKGGDLQLGKLLTNNNVFNADTLSQYVLIMIDTMEDMLLLLAATDALTFDLVKFGKLIDALKAANDTLLGLLGTYLTTQKALYTIKTTIGDGAPTLSINAIAQAMPEILAQNTSKIIILLVNTDAATITKLTTDLKAANTATLKQQVVDAAYNKLDKDGIRIPASKDINYIEDPVLRDVYDHLKSPGCLCGYEGLQILHDLLQKEIDALKQFNLFSVFTKKHPGIQHKAGVPTGGTFIIAYHRKGTASVQQFTNFINGLTDGVVVADFYLPYLCNSDCQPVNFNVVVPVPPVTLGLEKTEFCIADATPSYLFQANPTGGKLTTTADQKDSIKDNGDGTFSFIPAKVVIPANAKDVTVTYTYTLGDQMQTLNVKVYAYPQVKIVAAVDPTNPLKVNFSLDKPGIVAGATWTFGDTTTATGLTPSHVYTNGGAYKIGCTAQNGICTYPAETVTVNVKAPDPVVIGLQVTQICKTAAAVAFNVTPAGGTGTGEGFTESPAGSGKFKFTPSAVASNGTPQKTVTFNYTPLAGVAKSASVTVFEQPAATLDIVLIRSTQSPTAAQFQFNNLVNAVSIEVDLGDGSPKTTYSVQGQPSFRTPVHLFPGGGPFTVAATLINGTCTRAFNPLNVSFDVAPVVVKSCQPLSIPVSDYTTLRKELAASQRFIAAYDKVALDQLDKFFAALKEQVAKDPNVPLSFFAQNPIDPTWIAALPLDPETRALSIRLLAILSDLISTISCLKGEDIDQGSVVTKTLMDAVIAKLKQLQKLTTTDAKAVQAIVDDVNDELKRITSNKEDNLKTVFAKELNTILALIKSIS